MPPRAQSGRACGNRAKPAIRATPTTPPAIAPVFELPLDEDGTGDEVLGLTVDWLARVGLGTIEALPVTSGESVTEPRIRGSLAKNTHHPQPAPLFHSSNRK
jgi:hypothetical protein